MADAWIEETLPQAISTLTTKQHFKSQFSTLTTNADRVQFCLAQKEVQHWVDRFMSKFSANRTGLKCSTTADKFRKKGNDHFREHKFERAIQLYSRAICFAPQIGLDETASELALAFENRSAAYFEIGQYDNALKDIEDALTFGYGQFESETKLQLNKCDCLIRLERVLEADEFLNSIQKPTDDEDDSLHWIELFDRISLDDDKKKKDDLNPKSCDVSLIAKLANKGLFKSNEKMSSFSSKVAVQYDEVKGRHLVAQEDIEFGDILAVSRPYVTFFELKNDVLKYCHHCCRDISLESTPIRPIPCIGCSSVVYCSEECRTESANSYHRYECGQTDLLVQLTQLPRMSLRILYSAGMDQIRSVVNSVLENGNYISEQAEGHYSHVYQLVHHSTGPLKDLKMSYNEMLVWSIMACLLLQLAKKSNFPMNAKEEDLKLIGGILLRHFHQLRFNTFDYSLLIKAESPLLLNLYPMFASTLNHSCQANARLEASSPKHQSDCLLQAARPISAGTEITISYLRDESGCAVKIADLFKDQHLVKCFCSRCSYRARNTPFGHPGGYLALGCSDCGHLMEHSSKHRSKSEVFRCTACRLTMTNAEMKRRYLTFGRLQLSFLQLYQSNQNALSKLLKIFEQIEALLHRDAEILFDLRGILSMCYLKIGRLDKWWDCAEHFLSIYERTFGVQSIELIEAFNLVPRVGTVEMCIPEMIKRFEQQDSEEYERYLARMEQWKQLKLKYYPDY